ncbi:M23 family metallopeptidase [Gemmobacter denitrificans]|uniref:M23 family metallopeptidase n=1 Tax=Gemmobacter denitrificans TaxID=3123040 RepID=A0ABU8BUL2_9RHOB
MIRALSLGLILAPAAAGAFDLGLPVACTLGETCHIQQFPDRDPGPAARDYTCGSLSYDGHDGTDFALPSLAAMTAGVDVLAAAPGVVRGARDGMPDILISDPAAPPLEGRDCGNGLAITHTDGWETQYCHLKQGSVQVKPGDAVQAGQVLGQIGLSGNTEFPHLHLTVRQNGVAVDPFAPGDMALCGKAGDDLWSAPLPYQPGGIIAIGFADAVPDYGQVKAGLAAQPLRAAAPALVVWAYLFGTRAGDRLQLTLTGPQGEVVADTIALDRTQAQAMRAIGRKLRDSRWPPGRYQGQAILLRDGAEVDRAILTADLP